MLAYLSIVSALDASLLIISQLGGVICKLWLRLKKLKNQMVCCAFSPIYSKNITAAEWIKLIGPDPRYFNN